MAKKSTTYTINSLRMDNGKCVLCVLMEQTILHKDLFSCMY